MRIKITFFSDKPGVIDFNYQHQVQGLIYCFLADSSPDYATWLHQQGFVYNKDKSFKLFVFSGITFHKPIKIRNGFIFNGAPHDLFTLSLQIAAPVHQFIQHLINGIFKEGSEVSLGRQKLNIHTVETLPHPLHLDITPKHNMETVLSPLESPIFVKKPMPEGHKDLYLFPGDEEYEELLNQNLIHKYKTLYGKKYDGNNLKFQFHPMKGKSVKSFKVYKNGGVADEIKGTLQPFTVTGPLELMNIGLDCGFGQNNSLGCGYVENWTASG